MRAFVRTGATNGEVRLTEVPVPGVGDSEVLVRVVAFGVGIHDRFFIPPDARFPYVIGTEAAGIVVATGAGTQHFAPGDRVLLASALQPKGGTWAEFAVGDEASVLAAPHALDLTIGAGIPIAGKTAIESLHSLGLRRGATLFVAGGSGAIGTLVIQMAVARQIRVAASASAKNHDHLHSLGAELAVDYAAPDWQQDVVKWARHGADAALAIQPGTGEPCQYVVRQGGHVVTVSGDRFAPVRDVRVEQLAHRPDARRELADLVAAVAEGRIRMVVERVYPFAEAVSALEKTETRHARGKLVVAGARATIC